MLAYREMKFHKGGESFVRTGTTSKCQTNCNDTISENTGFKEQRLLAKSTRGGWLSSSPLHLPSANIIVLVLQCGLPDQKTDVAEKSHVLS